MQIMRNHKKFFYFDLDIFSRVFIVYHVLIPMDAERQQRII
jgi:hypothetical protein